MRDLIWLLLCVCVRASLLTRHQNMWGLLLAKKKDQLAMNEAVKNLKLIIMECEFPRMAAWRRRMLMLKTSSLWEFFFANWLDFYCCSKKEKRKKKVFYCYCLSGKHGSFRSQSLKFYEDFFFFFLFILEWDSYFSHAFVCVRACGLGCCLIEKCGFIKAFWHFDLVEKQTLLIPVLLRRELVLVPCRSFSTSFFWSLELGIILVLGIRE